MNVSQPIIVISYLVYFTLILLMAIRPGFLGRTLRLFLKRLIVKITILGLSSYIMILVFLYTNNFTSITNYDGFFQIVGDTAGIFAGLFLVFYYDRAHENVVALEQFLDSFTLLREEINFNIESIEVYINRPYKENLLRIKTTVWEVYKETIHVAPIEWITNLTNIYYLIILLGDIQTRENRINDSELIEIYELIIDTNNLWQNETHETIETRLIESILN